MNGKRETTMARRDAERRECSAAGKQLPNAFGCVSIPLLPLSVRVGGSLPEQTEDVMKLNAVVAARGDLRLLRRRSLGTSRSEALLNLLS